jgi:light-harvesting protein B-800-850 alpha chain
MNNAKMWLVVKPTVGIPLFLSAVAIGSFAVHVAVLSNTGWVGNFLKGKSFDAAALDLPAKDAVVTLDGKDAVTIVLPDGRTAKVIFPPSVDGTKTAMAAEILPDKQ